MADQSPNCHEAESNLDRVLSELRARDILKGPYQDMVALAFNKCASCRKKQTKCTGWHLSLTGAAVVEFQAFKIDSHRLTARIEGSFSTQRSNPARRLDDWHPHPCRISTCAIDIFELPDSELVGRHHHDLAWPAQPGPVWHLQLGGAGADNRWLDVPRWPIAPMDPVLVIELAVYSFFLRHLERAEVNQPMATHHQEVGGITAPALPRPT